jgi:hypothetical protein
VHGGISEREKKAMMALLGAEALTSMLAEEYGALGHVATALSVPMVVVDETIHGAVAPMD